MSLGEHLSDLDALVLACRDARTRELLAESVACYRAGAFRASIVTLWIGVVFDVIHKLRELSMAGDAQARTLLAEHEESRRTADVRAALAFEQAILARAERDFQLVSPLEREDLERLLGDRNRCAHPSLRDEDDRYDPPAELARAHIVNASRHLFARPPTQGKASLDRMFAEVQSASFPRSMEQAVEVLRHGPLSRPKPALVRNFVMATVARLLDEGVVLDEAERLSAALRGTVHLHRAACEATLLEAGCAERLRAASASARVTSVIRAFALVPELRAAARDDVQALLRQFLETAPVERLSEALPFALDLPFLADGALRSIATLARQPLEQIVGRSARAEFADRALQLYVAAATFREANEIADSLVLPLMDVLTAEQGLRIMAASEVRNSQVGGSTRFRVVRERLVARGLVPAPPPPADD